MNAATRPDAQGDITSQLQLPFELIAAAWWLLSEVLKSSDDRHQEWVTIVQDFSEFFMECDLAPRLNEFSAFFSSTAAGHSGMPVCEPIFDRRLLPNDLVARQFMHLHELRRGPFDRHYLSSIPYRLEEECRIGRAILKYAKKKVLRVYSLGTAEATMARTISELANGRIETLSCSPNVENLRSFYAYGVPPYATFFHGPFHHLTAERMKSESHLRQFADGFDLIFEDTTFQMYSRNRHDQIRFVSQHLKPDGLFMCVEKFKATTESEYALRERQKDFGFKARFFSMADIEAKKETILDLMDRNEVTLQEFTHTLVGLFSHSVVTWNSGNFYTVLASNNRANLDRFVSGLSEPAIPAEYVYESIPFSPSPTEENAISPIPSR